eukprot:165789_1
MRSYRFSDLNTMLKEEDNILVFGWIRTNFSKKIYIPRVIINQVESYYHYRPVDVFSEKYFGYRLVFARTVNVRDTITVNFDSYCEAFTEVFLKPTFIYRWKFQFSCIGDYAREIYAGIYCWNEKMDREWIEVNGVGYDNFKGYDWTEMFCGWTLFDNDSQEPDVLTEDGGEVEIQADLQEGTLSLYNRNIDTGKTKNIDPSNTYKLIVGATEQDSIGHSLMIQLLAFAQNKREPIT